MFHLWKCLYGFRCPTYLAVSATWKQLSKLFPFQICWSTRYTFLFCPNSALGIFPVRPPGCNSLVRSGPRGANSSYLRHAGRYVRLHKHFYRVAGIIHPDHNMPSIRFSGCLPMSRTSDTTWSQLDAGLSSAATWCSRRKSEGNLRSPSG